MSSDYKQSGTQSGRQFSLGLLVHQEGNGAALLLILLGGQELTLHPRPRIAALRPLRIPVRLGEFLRLLEGVRPQLLAFLALDPADLVLDDGHGLIGGVQRGEEILLVVVERDLGAVETQVVGELQVVLGGEQGRLVLLGQGGDVGQSRLGLLAVESLFELEVLQRVGGLDPLREVDCGELLAGYAL